MEILGETFQCDLSKDFCVGFKGKSVVKFGIIIPYVFSLFGYFFQRGRGTKSEVVL